MSKFKNVIFNQCLAEAFSKNDARFLIDHGINPIVIDKRIPLYYPEIDSMIRLVGVDHTSPYFKNNDLKSDWDVNLKTFPEDKVYIVPFEEKRNDTHNVYVTKPSEKISITAEKFLDEIYNNEENYDVTSIFELSNFNKNIRLNSPEDISTTRELFKQNLDKKHADDNQAFEKQKAEYLEKNPTVFDNVADKNTLIKKLLQLEKEGYEPDDLIVDFTIWVYNADIQAIVKTAKAALMKKIGADQDSSGLKKQATDDFNAFLKQIYLRTRNQNKKTRTKDLLRSCIDWMNEYVKTATTESVLTEYGRYNKPKKVSMLYGNKGLDKRVLEDQLEALGISKKHLTVPIVIRPDWDSEKYKNPEDDPLAEPTAEIVIRGFPDVTNPTVLRVRDLISGESYNMTVPEVQAAIKSDWNSSAEKRNELGTKFVTDNGELNNINFRTDAKHSQATHNKNLGTFVDLPEELILQALEHMEDDFEYPNLVKKYKANKSNPLVLKALKASSDAAHPIKYNASKDTFQIFEPYDPDTRLNTSMNSTGYSSIFNYGE